MGKARKRETSGYGLTLAADLRVNRCATRIRRSVWIQRQQHQETFSMGLIEDRAVNAYREHCFPRWKERLEAFLGYPIEIDVEWSELTSPGFGDWYFQNLTEIYFLPLQYALQQVAYDDLGRKALQVHLKSIAIRNRNDNSNSLTMVSFEDGRLVIDHLPHVNCAEIVSRTIAIRDCLEQKL